MTAEELQTLDYMTQIEQIYSCTSFEMAKLLRTEGTHRFDLNTQIIDKLCPVHPKYILKNLKEVLSIHSKLLTHLTSYCDLL